MIFRLTLAALLLLLLAGSVLGCGGTNQVGTDTGPIMVGEFGETDREVSAAFRYFFLDSVNHESMGRWTVSNDSGKKAFVLSNTYNSAPKAWVIGQNYWNNENDTLTSNLFTIPDDNGFEPGGTSGVRLAFWSRWLIAPDDVAYVELNTNNQGWQAITTFTGGSNAAYPNWNKYSFLLPDNQSGGDQSVQLRFRFTSDGATTDWGFGVDNVSVYQTKQNPPINVAATDGIIPEAIAITWDHNVSGTLVPDGYAVYRSTDQDGVYQFIAGVDYPETVFDDLVGADPTIYWYKVKAVRFGYPDSEFSNSDSGFAGMF
jgi:hypothetical protein